MRYLLLLLLTFFSTVHAKEIVTYLHTDLQGSVVMQSNVHGEVITENKRYAPYGGRLDHQEEEGDVSYISKKFNHGTGLSYLNARYYDPEIGRFLSVDPVDVLQQGGRHFNRYTYAYNSPYNLKDPDGELPFLIPLAIFIAKEVTGEVFESYTGIPAPTIKNLGKTAISVAIKQANKDIIKGATKVPSSVTNKGPYSHLKDHPSVDSGKNFTQTQKKKILAENRKRNGGELRSDLSGEPLEKALQHKKGVTPPSNEAHIDHICERCTGGSNSFGNARVLSREENLSRPGRQ